MKPDWSSIKNIINRTPKRCGLYLSLIDGQGFITCANAGMMNEFDLDNPRLVQTNFFDLIYSGHVEGFRSIIADVDAQNTTGVMELYVKNGTYHPMKWEVNYLGQSESGNKTIFCVGYKIIDERRLEKFNKLVERHQQLILEGLTGTVFHDKNGELIAVNQQTARMFNSTLERLYALKDIRTLWQGAWEVRDAAGNNVPFENTPFMKAASTGKPCKETLRIRLLNGEQRWILFDSQPLPFEQADDEHDYILSNIIDVTNEKLLAERVEEKKALLDSFVKQTPNLAWVVDDESNLMLGSSAFFQYFGIDEATGLNRKMEELVPAFVFKALYDKHVKVLATGLPLKVIERVKLADGSDFISHINIFPIEIPGKRLVGGHAIHLPDTNRIEAELRVANDRLLTLTRAAANAIWEWDMQTGKIFRNEVLMEMIGYHTDDSKGLSWWLRRIHPEDRNRVSDKVKEATENNQHSWQDEYRFKCADGVYKHIQDKGFVIYENGLPVKMIGSLHDISDLRALEDKLADEKMHRQKEISETIIRVQEKERTRIGHELHDNVNQILSTTVMFVEMLDVSGKEQKQVKGKTLDYLKLAIEEIRKLSKELVIPQFKEQGLANSIQSLIDDIHMAHAIRIKFTHDLNTNLLTSGKKITLFRIVQEQTKNILKHSQATQASILLFEKNDEVQLVIKDNGVGFDSTKTHRGIGLSNIYERVSFYNGKVDIQTANGKGCTVSVTVSLY